MSVDLAIETFVRREGAELVHQFDWGEEVKEVVHYDGRLLIATSRGVYALSGDKVVPLEAVRGDGAAGGV